MLISMPFAYQKRILRSLLIDVFNQRKDQMRQLVYATRNINQMVDGQADRSRRLYLWLLRRTSTRHRKKQESITRQKKELMLDPLIPLFFLTIFVVQRLIIWCTHARWNDVSHEDNRHFPMLIKVVHAPSDVILTSNCLRKINLSFVLFIKFCRWIVDKVIWSLRVGRFWQLVFPSINYLSESFFTFL